MFLPIGDSPNVARTPWLTWMLIAANVVIHIALWPLAFQPADPLDPALQQYRQALAQERGVVVQEVSRADLVRFEHGIKPSRWSTVDAFTSMFLHGSLVHLFGNMLFLWIFGDNVEHRLGPWGFLAAYLATGFLGAAGDAVLRWGSSIPSIGASGAISGVLGLYFAWFPHNRVRVVVFLFILLDVLELPARFVLGAYLVLNNLLPLLVTGGAGGVSYGAHIGGFVAGWALARGLGVPRGARWRERGVRASAASSTKPSGRAADGRSMSSPQADPLAESFDQARRAGRLADAFRLLVDSPRSAVRRALALDDLVALGEDLERAGQPRAALVCHQRALADHSRASGIARAHLGVARILLHAFQDPAAAYQHLADAAASNPDPAEEAEIRTLLAALRPGVRTVPRRW
ncbi:MAG: rhomboid family intramembrane serine protease [Acidobacteriota bacterium]